MTVARRLARAATDAVAELATLTAALCLIAADALGGRHDLGELEVEAALTRTWTELDLLTSSA